jgi:hypothetical protein
MKETFKSLVTVGDISKLEKPGISRWYPPHEERFYRQWCFEESRKSWLIKKYKVIPFDKWIKSHKDYDLYCEEQGIENIK